MDGVEFVADTSRQDKKNTKELIDKKIVSTGGALSSLSSTAVNTRSRGLGVAESSISKLYKSRLDEFSYDDKSRRFEKSASPV